MSHINENIQLEFIISHAKAYGFIFPSSEIYNGLSAVYDYGQYGVLLKNNIKNFWWKSMVQLRKDIIGIDSAIMMDTNIWKASGHINAFNDLMIENLKTKSKHKIDILIEEYIENKIQKEINKAKIINEEDFIKNNTNIIALNFKKKKIFEQMFKLLKSNNIAEIKSLLIELEIINNNWGNIQKCNLMFKTKLGYTDDKQIDIYLRPETAQGIFSNFSNVQKTGRMKIPFGIAQIGKAFRNEIIARQFIFRMKEFEQMEMQFFIAPHEDKKWFSYWKNIRLKWYLSLGLDKYYFKFKNHTKLAHYANAATDIEYKFPFGFKELEGIHSRTDFDLRNHQKFSKKKLQYYDPYKKCCYIPYVIETSAGLDRIFLSIFSYSLKKELLPNGNSRIVLKLPPTIAPIKAAIFPLVNKDGLPEIAINIFNKLKLYYNIIYEEKESIGKRYRRQDAIGTPFCITVDYESLSDNNVTIRFRDSMLSKRVSIKNLKKFLENHINMKILLKKIINIYNKN
ncbi:MAG: glycine--tRNA ligase [Candidatus Bostrichicola ureolyticus]|nr:MAG: glycine--tRNA ligase [Candidatus Bostrichicola ureolyticus]